MKKFTFSILFGLISLCGFSQIGLTENFDSGLVLPTGWTSDSGDYFGAVVQVCQTLSPRANLFDGNTTAHLTSPNIVGASNASELTVTFDYKIVDWSAATDATPPGWGEIRIQYSTNNGGNWTTIETINDDNHITSNECFNFSTTVDGADLPTGSDFKLRIDATWLEGTYYIYIDNVTATQVVVDPPSCVNLITPANGANGVGINTNLEWSAASGIPTGYTLTVGTTPGGTDVVDNQDVGLSTSFNFAAPLEYSTTYYVTVLGYNANGPAEGCEEFSFTTGADPNAPVDCAAGTPINTVFCYDNNETMTWNFQSSDGGPMNVFFNAGQMEGCCDEVTIYDGTDNTGVVLYDDNNGGDMTGVSVNSTTGFIFIEIDSDGSVSCASNGYTPLNFDVSCIDTTAVPNCNSVLTTPANGSVDVNENTDITWSSASIIVTGYTISIGTTPGGTDILDSFDNGPATTYDPGTLDYETTYYVTIVPYNDNGPAINCNEQSFTTRDDPNQVLDCTNGEVINTTYCYEQNDTMVFNYASNDGSQISVVFNSGWIEAGWDELIVTDSDGTIIFQGDNGGDLTGLSFLSSGDSISVAVDSDGSVSCQSTGNAQWDFTVSCFDATSVPNCNATLTGEVANGTIDVNENEDLTWSAASVLVTGYIINMGTTPGGTDVLNGVDVGNVLTYEPGVLNFSTTYYVTIIPYNDNGNATGCIEESFTTRDDPNQIVDCASNQVINTTYCYAGNDTMEFNFASSDGSQLVVFFNAGWIEAGWDELIVTDSDGTIIFQGDNGGDLSGLVFISSGDSITIGVNSDGVISCAGSTNAPWDFDVTCFDATAVPNCDAEVLVPADDTIDVAIDTDITWSAASIFVTGYTISIGTTPGGTDVVDNFDVGNVLTYDPGILTNATEYYVTVIPYNDNGPADTDCTESSFKTICIPQVVSFNAVGDCETDPDNPDFVIEVNITDLSGSASIIVSDDQGSAPQTADTIGIVTMGPYAANTVVTITTIKSDDDTCDVISSPITFICPPPPNPCSIIYAGEDVTIGCEESTDLEASYHLFGQDTNTYIINGLDACPLPTTVGGTPTSLDIDDRWSEVIDIGFEFCFFGDTYTQLLVGSNGVLSFELENAETGNGWAMAAGDLLPNNTNPTLAEANIFGVGHDIDPGVSGDINYLVIGTAPYRMFVVNYTDVAHFSSACNQTLFSSSQIILYESSNNIDVNIFEKPICSGWNGGRAVVGVQNIAGDTAFTPPGRNTGVWEVTPDQPESWRFAPSEGTPNYTFEWFDGTTSLGNTETVTVSPTVTTTYTATVTYELCTGGTATLTDDVTVEVITDSTDDPSFTVEATCDGAIATITGTQGGMFQFSPEPGDGAVIDPDTGEVTNGVSGETYTIQYIVSETGTCPASSTQDVTILSADDASFIISPACDGGTATVTGVIGGTFAFNPQPGDGAMIDPDTGTVTGGMPETDYTIEYTTNGDCPSSSTQVLTTLTVGGGFMEDFGTSPDRESTPYTNYTFNEFTQVEDGEYTLNNNATDLNTGWHDMEDHTSGDTDGLMFVVNASNAAGEFYRRSIFVSSNTEYNFSAWITTVYDIDTAICPGTGVPSNVTFRIEDEFGNLITEVNTGDIQNESNPNWQEYQLNFNTLSNSQIQLVLLNQGVGGCGNDLAIDDISLTAVQPVLSFTPDCEGGTVTVTGTSGGTFVFNPAPTDGAVIDEMTGVISGGTPGATYSVEYIVPGGCASNIINTTLLPGEDASFTVLPTCDGGLITITGDVGGSFAFNPVPTDGATIDPITGNVTNGMVGTAYTVEYTTAGTCPAISSQTFTVLPQDDASFTMSATCDGGTATVTGLSGGTFVLNPDPQDGTTIDPATGTVSGGVIGETYMIEYITNGQCPSSSFEAVTPLSAEDATFAVTAVCGGAEVEIIGDTGGTFAFNPDPGDGATINVDTGLVEGATGDTEYSIEYTTSGPCPTSTTESFIALQCIIPQVITPNDDGFNDSFDLSGYNVSSLEVFNRNGVKVYSKTNGYTNEFNGVADNGDELPVGTYFYVMKYQGGKERTSWVYINK
ncbi:T9SS type B sorting domain-containing protein [Hanstruepera ponticola]|uniref:T9SS type B sorting domain-containing protein n=1 Tax=Hanstruepera ponticola TaxID=2042995 RepID=UPI00177EE87F|nr:gliding motility-associated C-terminal domain-containing protein [Hanstruepera ponticola]